MRRGNIFGKFVHLNNQLLDRTESLPRSIIRVAIDMLEGWCKTVGSPDVRYDRYQVHILMGGFEVFWRSGQSFDAGKTNCSKLNGDGRDGMVVRWSEVMKEEGNT